MPTVSPFERLRNMLVFRNRIYLHRTTCAATAQSILSAIPPQAGHTIYDAEYWDSDRWDGLEYGRDYDFSRTFFSQFADLFRVVPLPNLAVIRSTMENSDYCNGITGAKNSYLLFTSHSSQDCMHSMAVNHSRDIFDCIDVKRSELCYGCEHIVNCYQLFFASNCENCSDSSFLVGCSSCRNCFGCVNLVNKEYVFFNEQLTKADFEARISAFDLGSASKLGAMERQFRDYAAQFPKKFCWGKLSESSSGNYINESKRCSNCYYVTGAEDLEHSFWITRGKSSFFHCSFGMGSELIYNSVTCGDGAYNLKFCVDCWPNTRDLEYCIYTGRGAESCFACVGLRRRKHCILNKQYSQSEYEHLVRRIKEHMRSTGEYGRFFPPQLSPFAYNRSEARYYLPSHETYVTGLGYRWETEPLSELTLGTAPPDQIRDVTDDVLEQTFQCERSGRSYKIQKKELHFHRTFHLPLPRCAPLNRIETRAECLRFAPLEHRICARCSTNVLTMFGDHPAGILCENCFQEEAQ
ncbi:MAG: hypothetical protein U0136_16125 [Bdellovibrionota bacterium]